MKKGSYFGGYILGVLVTIFVLLKSSSFSISIPDYGSGSGTRSYRPLFKSTGFSLSGTT